MRCSPAHRGRRARAQQRSIAAAQLCRSRLRRSLRPAAGIRPTVPEPDPALRGLSRQSRGRDPARPAPAQSPRRALGSRRSRLPH